MEHCFSLLQDTAKTAQYNPLTFREIIGVVRMPMMKMHTVYSFMTIILTMVTVQDNSVFLYVW